jgi:hypothetical membrane protein
LKCHFNQICKISTSKLGVDFLLFSFYKPQKLKWFKIITMFSIYSQIRRNIKTKSYKLTIFEIVIFGALLAIYILTAYIENFLFPRGFRLSITYAIFIIFGLALGP